MKKWTSGCSAALTKKIILSPYMTGLWKCFQASQKVLNHVVDDGSRDQTIREIESIQRSDDRVKYVSFLETLGMRWPTRRVLGM